MKLVVIGHARHGKDTVANLLHLWGGLPAESSSWIAAERFIYAALLAEGHKYRTLQECWEDRTSAEMRTKWYNLIVEFNKDDPTRLMKLIFEKNDIYVGLRNRDEFLAGKLERRFDLSIWVDATERLPEESDNSMTLSKQDADIIIDNNSTLTDLHHKVYALVRLLNISSVSPGGCCSAETGVQRPTSGGDGKDEWFGLRPR